MYKIKNVTIYIERLQVKNKIRLDGLVNSLIKLFSLYVSDYIVITNMIDGRVDGEIKAQRKRHMKISLVFDSVPVIDIHSIVLQK